MIVGCCSLYGNPLHQGHIEYLRKAKEQCDRLVVIVNNDKQVMLKKGFIFMKEDERMAIISAIRYVDECVLSIDEDRTVCKTLDSLTVHKFMNGGDRTTDEVPEKKICDAKNIEMIDGLGDKINSSTEIVARLKRN
jgi:cytidyltransferase-like protein